MREIGVYSADQILTIEDLPPRGIDDDFLEPGNMRRLSADSGADLSGIGVQGSNRSGTQATVLEARCPGCNSMLGKSVSSAALWCRSCKVEVAWTNGALAGAGIDPFGNWRSEPKLAAPRNDAIDMAERLADMLLDRIV
jgi:hypothetical protein